MRKSALRLMDFQLVYAMIFGSMSPQWHARRLAESEDIVSPVVTQPDVWELRYPYEAPLSGNRGSPRQYRMYYAEDEFRGPQMVALLFHRKETEDLSAAVQRDRQNARMGEAQERFTLYRYSNWGHRSVKCRYCFHEKGGALNGGSA